MVDKDDIFQEEDNINPQKHDGEEPSSGEDDDILDLFDEAETSDDTIDEEVIDLAEIAEESDEDVLELSEEADDDEILDLDEAVDEADAEEEDDILDLTDTAAVEDEEVLDLTEAAEDFEDDEILDLNEAVDEGEAEAEEEVMDLTEPLGSNEPDRDEYELETPTTPSAGYEEDKELLELIDDIQATLNDKPITDDTEDQEETAEDVVASDMNIPTEDAESYEFLDDDEFIASEELPESETEFVDHLGIDLTSEIERKALEEMEEAAMEDVQPTKGMEPATNPDSVESTVIKQALTEMLADQDNSLVKAIEKAVKKALGQGETD
jgi:pilus assembly protein FimV